jgi:hypothetical protein
MNNIQDLIVRNVCLAYFLKKEFKTPKHKIMLSLVAIVLIVRV